jgi:hypothetical protein
MFQPLNAKVDPPNYNFSLETLQLFFPDNKISDVEAKYGKGEKVPTLEGPSTKKYLVNQQRYKFPVLVQDKEGVIEDFFARLPSYFLHDVFLQGLVNRLGKQQTYKKVGEEAFYVWDDGKHRHVYSAACTITCFPIFYTVSKKDLKKPLLDQMRSK